jgi:hypothetical protein
MTNLAGETIDARCVDCIYIYIYTYICMIDRLDSEAGDLISMRNA